MDKKAALREQVKHGTSSFPLKIYYPAIVNQNHSLEAHWHREFEISIVTKGEADYKIQHDFYHVAKGDLILISPELIHSASCNHGRYCEHITLVFDLSLLCSNHPDSCTESYILPLLNGKICISPYCFKDESIRHSIHAIKDAYFHPVMGYELKIKRELFSIMDRIFELNMIRQNHMNAETELIKNILYLLEHSFCKQVYISHIADKLNYSESHISKSFKAYTGITIIDYVNNLRLKKAAELLLTQNRTITEVALLVGFNNMSYFSKMFHKKYGVTPKEYSSASKS